MLSTVHKGELRDTTKIDRQTGAVVKKPDVICDYKINMRLVDKADMMSSYADCTRKSKKWPTRVFQHLLRLCLLNAFILFKQVNPAYKKCFRVFTTAVLEQILAQTTTRVRNRILSNETRLACRGYLEFVSADTKSFKRCFVCSHTVIGPKRRKMVRTQCKGCKVPLCPVPCHERYHTALQF